MTTAADPPRTMSLAERLALADKEEEEAEEEEETGMQAGLEDFGFGTSKVREGDEERDALKMRADA